MEFNDFLSPSTGNVLSGYSNAQNEAALNPISKRSAPAPYSQTDDVSSLLGQLNTLRAPTSRANLTDLPKEIWLYSVEPYLSVEALKTLRQHPVTITSQGHTHAFNGLFEIYPHIGTLRMNAEEQLRAISATQSLEDIEETAQQLLNLPVEIREHYIFRFTQKLMSQKPTNHPQSEQYFQLCINTFCLPKTVSLDDKAYALIALSHMITKETDNNAIHAQQRRWRALMNCFKTIQPVIDVGLADRISSQLAQKTHLFPILTGERALAQAACRQLIQKGRQTQPHSLSATTLNRMFNTITITPSENNLKELQKLISEITDPKSFQAIKSKAINAILHWPYNLSTSLTQFSVLPFVYIHYALETFSDIQPVLQTFLNKNMHFLSHLKTQNEGAYRQALQADCEALLMAVLRDHRELRRLRGDYRIEILTKYIDAILEAADALPATARADFLIAMGKQRIPPDLWVPQACFPLGKDSDSQRGRDFIQTYCYKISEKARNSPAVDLIEQTLYQHLDDYTLRPENLSVEASSN